MGRVYQQVPHHAVRLHQWDETVSSVNDSNIYIPHYLREDNQPFRQWLPYLWEFSELRTTIYHALRVNSIVTQGKISNFDRGSL